MGGEPARLMWLLLMLFLARQAQAMCPVQCICNDDVLEASCPSNGLTVVPIQLNPAVQHIDLFNNKITNILLSFSFYNNLISLNLSENKIQTLGSSNFESQRNLKHLNLSRNEVETLSKDSLKGLRVLTVLDLSFNRLEELSALAFRELHSLELLKLTNNQLVFLDTELLRPTKLLRELHLDDNQILEFPGTAIIDSINLQHLSLSRNLIASIDEGVVPVLPALRILLLDVNVIADIHPGALAGLAAMERLHLGDNNFTAIPTTSLAKLSNLTELQFSGNFIRTVPPVAFRGLFQLRSLHLDRLEFLTRIDSRAFVDNINLEKVYLDDNIDLHSLPTRLFHGNPRIVHISIRNNELTALDASHFPLDQLRTLELGGNPLQCNCSLLWLWLLEQEQVKRNACNESDDAELSVDLEEIRCAGPEPLVRVLLIDASESQLGCSMGWVATLSVVTSILILIVVTSAVLYRDSLKRRFNKPELPAMETASCPEGNGLGYVDPRVDKYMIGPPLIHEYRTLAAWDHYSRGEDVDIYKPFDSNIVKTRPHIVYV